jgi:hypothetical protein
MRLQMRLAMNVGVLLTISLSLTSEMRVTAVATQNTAVATSDELERRDQPVTNEDLRILQRANQILASSTVWNRHDTRICNPTDKTWSLFCALEKASLEVLGEYRHRDVALQEVRFAVEDATKGKEFEHRLMDYNNLPSTTFADIKRILKVATDRVSGRLAAQNSKKQP